MTTPTRSSTADLIGRRPLARGRRHFLETKMDTTHSPYSNTPDPVRHPAFYDGVVLKRVFAFIIDTILIALVTMLLMPSQSLASSA